MKQMNVIGNIADDCRRTEQGVLYFTMAVDNGKTATGEKNSPLWINVYNVPSSLEPYLKKGVEVFVSGSFKSSIYMAKNQDGTERPVIDTTIFTPLIQLLRSPKDKKG